jgi:LysR family transcriptional activator of nhaA
METFFPGEQSLPLVPLNFHHLQYFRAVAEDGNLSRTARQLRVSQSALSTQIRQLESQLGVSLFSREGRSLRLTEAGKLALTYASDIFSAGGELVSTLQEGRRRSHVLRVGAVATLSRNFQRSFLRPVAADATVRLQLSSGSLDELVSRLEQHQLDVVLSNRPAVAGGGGQLVSSRLARQPVSIVSVQAERAFRFPHSLSERGMVLPGPGSELRSEFNALCDRLRVKVRVLAEVDDMSLLRLVAQDSGAPTLVPSVVVRDELRDGRLHELCVVPELSETFYALTVPRRFPHPLLQPLLERPETALLDAEERRLTRRAGPPPRGNGPRPARASPRRPRRGVRSR